MILTVLIGALGAATVLSFLDGLSWHFELGTMFRLQYAVVLTAAAVAAVLLRHYPAALGSIALVAINVAVIAPSWTSPPRAELISSPTLRVLMVNVEVGNDRYADVEALIRAEQPDLVGIIELTPDWARELGERLPDYHERQLAVEDGAYGVGLYGRSPLKAEIERFPADGPASVVASLELAGEPVSLVLTHVHTPFAGDVHQRHFESLAAARERLGERLVICGDFNTVPWAQPFRELARSGGLSETHGGGGFSWPTWNPLLRLQLDNCLISDGLAVAASEKGPDVGSDHFPLIIEIGITQTADDRGKSPFAGLLRRANP